jgi:hypothetical protein
MKSPVTTHSPLFYAHLNLDAGSTAEMCIGYRERAIPTLQKRFSKAELNELRLTGILKVSLVALWAATAAASVASAQEPERPSQEAFIKRAVVTQQRLWLLSDSGALSSIVDGGAKRIVEHISEPVFDVCVQNGDPLQLGQVRVIDL